MARNSIQVEHLTIDGQQVEIRRSARRRRSVQAYREAGRVIVLVPASLGAAERERWARTMIERVERSAQRRQGRRFASADDLLERAEQLRARYLRDTPAPTSIRWVGNQSSRWGSCTPRTGSIRISDRLQQMPVWVLDYVVLHELAHLSVPGHDARFWALVNQLPQAERAQGFLEGVAHAAGLPDWLDVETDPDAQSGEDDVAGG